MKSMFSGCEALSSIPDISKWDIANNVIISDMFNGCKSTLNIPAKFKKFSND